jgi:hypothetical protein
MSRRDERFEKRDWITVVLVCAMCPAQRLPFRCHVAYHRDGAQFTLADRSDTSG